MDKKLIQQYGEDILHYRLRTARQKKRMQYKDFDKQLIQIHKERKALYELKENLGWEPLVPPVQKGWKRFFVLRDDVAVSRQAEFFEEILKRINTYDWSHRKEFIVRRRKRGKKIYVVKEQKLLEPWPCHFAKLGFSDIERQMFHEVINYDKKGSAMKRYVFNEPWRFVLRVRPNMITRIRVKDGNIERRIKEIDDYLERSQFEWRLFKVLHGGYRWWRCNKDHKDEYQYKNWPLERMLDRCKEEL